MPDGIVPNGADDLSQLWAEYAVSYDRILPLMPFYQTAVRRHLEVLLGYRVRSCLDIGCGTGNVCVPLAFCGVTVDAVDVSGAMLDRTRAKVEAFGLLERIKTWEQPAEEVDLGPSESFDAVNFLLSLFCMDDGAGVLRKAVAALRIGGIVVFTEPTSEFLEEPLLALGRRIVFEELALNTLARDWDVVANAGHTLGSRVRNSSSPTSAGRRLRADDLPAELANLGCRVLRIADSHLGQCQHIVACKISS